MTDGIAIEPEAVDAVLFDLDGVLTSTERLHARAWKETFDRVLEAQDPSAEPFGLDTDYPQHVDGKPRERGVRDFLGARGIELPEGEPDAAPGLGSVAAIAERKNQRFHELLAAEGVDAYEDAVRLLDDLEMAEVPIALFSASRNARRVLEAGGLGDRFDVIVDGNVAADEGFEGKPAPDTLLEAARRLVAAPERTVVFEDAEAGVEAAARGGFGDVVGVDRVGHAKALAAAGADVVVETLDEVQVPTRRSEDLPSALDADEILERIDRARPVVFLDFDGTLSPIVRRPDMATIPDETRRAVAALADQCPVAIVSGRGLDDVRDRVGLEGSYIAGSHGFEIEDPEGERTQHEVAVEAVEAVDEAERELEQRLADVDGVILERKRFSLAVHDREVADRDRARVKEAVDAVLADHPDLRVSVGKRVNELQPDVDWHKGRAVEHLLGELDVDPVETPVVYVGDDVTDEDAFRVLEDGIRVLVRDGREVTHADYGLADPEQVRAFVELLEGTLREGPP